MEKAILTLGLALLLGTLYNLDYSPSLDLKQKYNDYKLTYNKEYTAAEDQYRFQVYLQTLEEIALKNARLGRQVYGETQFADITDEEFREQYLTLKYSPEEYANVPRESFSHITADPKEVDWRNHGAVTPVKNQLKCGSCWTFSTTGVLEGFFKVTTGELPSLSEQQLIDCSTTVDLNFGCNGGMPQRALNFVKRNGLTTEEGYPYQGVQGEECLMKGGVYKVKGSQVLDISEWALYQALQIQPVSIGVDAGGWKNYKPAEREVFNFEECGDNLNHAVLAVGFTPTATIVKNSWASTWGSSGYIYLERGKNTCGLWNTMVVPI
ncbi:unnamed protein product [Paramecium octaurelia]|uniref:cathepsin L n=1 Tax=Paramecium octaurelia TaxID=43137 RepID=A0A8S1X3U9_PAROT|nr:unnamed protein product [Paramecium octaurelia]